MNSYKPRLFVSRCLGFEHCRWNAEMIDDPLVEKLIPLTEIVHDCPEMGIGLGCPRDPVRCVGEGLDPDAAGTPANDRTELYQPATGLRCGSAMREWAQRRLSSLPEVEGFLLKSRSPSCGWKDVKVYNSFDPGAGSKVGAGIFGSAVLAARPGVPVEDEGRLKNYSLRERFLGSLWTLARFRSVAESGSMGGLVAFHTVHKLYFLLIDDEGMRKLGLIVANHEHRPFPEVLADYRTTLLSVLAGHADFGSFINVIQHAFGGFSDSLSRDERKLFVDLVEQYRDERIPASVLLALVKSWATRFGNRYLLEQVVFEPYPLSLVSISDSGKGRSGC